MLDLVDKLLEDVLICDYGDLFAKHHEFRPCKSTLGANEDVLASLEHVPDRIDYPRWIVLYGLD